MTWVFHERFTNCVGGIREGAATALYGLVGFSITLTEYRAQSASKAAQKLRKDIPGDGAAVVLTRAKIVDWTDLLRDRLSSLFLKIPGYHSAGEQSLGLKRSNHRGSHAAYGDAYRNDSLINCVRSASHNSF